MKNKTSKKGFTLAEMVICIAIVGAISAVAMFSYTQFSDNLNLSSASQEIALEIRQAQIYGVSVKENAVGSGVFTSGYGFQASLSDPTSYYIFVDLNNNGKYDGGPNCSASPECVEKISLRNSVSITGICGMAFGGVSVSCPLDAAIKTMNIVFLRPDPTALIRFLNISNNFYVGGGIYQPNINCPTCGTFQTGQIVLTSAGGKTANIIIQNTGQVSIQ